ncbi:MAG: PAS domain-containing sensor histidine kinase [Bacteroidota bacterium]
MRNSFIRWLIMGGADAHYSRAQYKRIMLLGLLSLITFFFAWVYIVFDVVTETRQEFVIYVQALAAGLTFFLNRKGVYNWAKYILLFSTNTTVYLFSAREPYNAGTLILFFSLILGAIALFDYEEKRKWYFFISLSTGLFLLTFFSDFTLLQPIEFSEQEMRTIFLINFLVIGLSSTSILIFIIQINYHSEKELKENEARLGAITEELEKSKQRYELAAMGTNSGIWDWDIKNNTVYNSPVWRKMLGYNTDDFPQIDEPTFLSLLHKDDRENFSNALKNHIEHKKPFDLEFRLMTKSGKYRWFSDKAQALWDDDGNPVRMVGSIVDITERKLAEDRIKRQNAMLAKTNEELDRFVYSTSHDLRAPLMSILGLINLTQKSENLDEIMSCLDMMKDRVEILDAFIKEIIDYSRNTRTKVLKETIHLKPMIEEVIKGLEYMDNVEEVIFEQNINEEDTLVTDPSRLKIILNNLISNAIKYRDKYKKPSIVAISFVENGKAPQIIIEDNGQGIEEGVQSKIFDMFFRASENSKGSGLGLYIVKEMIEKIKGDISLESKLGEGSKFTVTFT